jgi:hypothetical protein
MKNPKMNIFFERGKDPKVLELALINKKLQYCRKEPNEKKITTMSL